MNFESLSLCEPLIRSLDGAGYQTPTPIQQQAIPQILKGRDIIGCAQTGTGKTAAFALPTMQRLMSAEPDQTGAGRRRQRSGRRIVRCLILAPTRELAGQIGESLATYGEFTGLHHTVIFGGVGQRPQTQALEAGVDILVATPGRLLDLVGQGYADLSHVEILILDEADHMLDMGFIHDLRKIVRKVPSERQTLMFSATMPPEIRELAATWLRRPFEVSVAAVASTPERVSQGVFFVEPTQKIALLTQFLNDSPRSKTIVFSRTKRGADKIALCINKTGIRAVAIHGNKGQSTRKAVMREFDSNNPPVLVATDLAARGLDFSDVSYVINFDLPDAPETYVHRIGRTARAGNSGQAFSFCSRDERNKLHMIEKLTGQRMPVQQPSIDLDKLPATQPRVQPPRTSATQSSAANTQRSATGATTPRTNTGGRRRSKTSRDRRQSRSLVGVNR